MHIQAIDSSWVLKQDPSDIFARVGCRVEQSDLSRIPVPGLRQCGYTVLACLDHPFDIPHVETWHRKSGNHVK